MPKGGRGETKGTGHSMEKQLLQLLRFSEFLVFVCMRPLYISSFVGVLGHSLQWTLGWVSSVPPPGKQEHISVYVWMAPEGMSSVSVSGPLSLPPWHCSAFPELSGHKLSSFALPRAFAVLCLPWSQQAIDESSEAISPIKLLQFVSV